MKNNLNLKTMKNLDLTEYLQNLLILCFSFSMLSNILLRFYLKSLVYLSNLLLRSKKSFFFSDKNEIKKLSNFINSTMMTSFYMYIRKFSDNKISMTVIRLPH